MNLEKFRSLAWADFFLYSLIDPRALYKRIIQKEPDAFWLSFIVPVFVSLFGILLVSLIGRESAFFYYKISYGWILVFLFSLIKILIYTSFIDVAAQLFGYNGKIRELITLMNFSMLPELFVLPAVYPFIVGDFVPLFFYALFSIACFIWHVLIIVQSISEMHSIEFGRAFLIYIIPAIVFGTILFLTGIMLIINTAGYLLSFM